MNILWSGSSLNSAAAVIFAMIAAVSGGGVASGVASGQSLSVNAGGQTQGVYAADTNYIGGFVNNDPTMGMRQWSTQRYGSAFAYSFAVPNGVYDVDVQIVAPNAGARAFTVAVGAVVSPVIDLGVLGGVKAHYTYHTRVKVDAELLLVSFKASVGNALVNSLSVKRVEPHYVTEVHPIDGAAGTVIDHQLAHAPIDDTLLFVFEMSNGMPPYVLDNYLIRISEIAPGTKSVRVTLGGYPVAAGTMLRYFYMTSE